VRTLLLDASYHPVRVINWQKAIILILSGRAEVVAEFDDIKIRSTRLCLNLPKILRLFSPHRGNQQVQFNRYNVFYRDKFICQYCVKKFNVTELTFDHVVPQSRGGRTNWFNIVSCCHTCNRKKGSKTPEEAGLKLIKKPKQPKWTPYLCLRLKDDDPQEWFEFLQIRNVA
jgi:5-methylcytosine-specific restriction endonuclease McrA